MQITPIFLVLAAIIGLLIGLLVASLFSSRDSKDTDEETPPAALAKDGFAEAARLWYSPGVKKVIPQLDGEFYRDYKTLSEEQQSRVNKLAELFSVWTGKELESEKYIPVTQIKSDVGEELPPIGPVLDWSVAEALKNEEKEKVSPLGTTLKPKTIAGQISLILEKMLEGHPLKEKGIKLIENDHRGVDVWIGLEKYDGIDVVPYPEVQQFIRAAVAQWEREIENDGLTP